MENSKDAKGPWEWFWLFKRYLLWAIKDVIEAAACEINVDLGMDGSVECPPSPTSHHQYHPLSPPWIAPPLRSKTSQFYANPNTTVIACPPSEQVCDMQTYPKNAQRKTTESTKRIQCMTLLCSLLFKSTRVIQWIWWPTWIWKAIDHL